LRARSTTIPSDHDQGEFAMTSRTTPRFTAIALAAALGLAASGVAAPALAQNATTGQSGQQSGQQQTPSYSEQKLQSFANAATKISAVVREYRPQLRQAQQDGNRQQFQKLQQEAKKAMDEKIAATDGISSKEYQEIAQAAQQDKQLRQKVLGMMQQQGQGGQGQGGQGQGQQQTQ
jgi:predicted membrane metal-binding protein